MKKIVLFISLIFSMIYLVGCNEATPTETPKVTYDIPNIEPFRLSSIVDVTSTKCEASYAVFAPYTDTYNINCTKSSKIVVYTKEEIIAEGTTEIEVELKQDEVYGIKIETPEPSTKFKLHSLAKNNAVTLPYDVDTKISASSFSTTGDANDPLQSATINYTKRTGGKYIYSSTDTIAGATLVIDGNKMVITLDTPATSFTITKLAIQVRASQIDIYTE